MSAYPAVREATASSNGQATASDGGESVIDRDSHFNGLYETKQNLRIEGLAEGEIQCQGTLLVAEGARVKAKVTARTVTIAGQLDGEVLCRGVFQILPTGEVQASVSAHRLVVQEGGLYNGEFRMISASEPPGESGDIPTRAELDLGTTPVPTEAEIGPEAWWRRQDDAETIANDGDSKQSPDEST